MCADRIVLKWLEDYLSFAGNQTHIDWVETGCAAAEQKGDPPDDIPGFPSFQNETVWNKFQDKCVDWMIMKTVYFPCGPRPSPEKQQELNDWMNLGMVECAPLPDA